MSGVPWHHLFTRLGVVDEAMDHFEHAVQAGFRNRRWMESDPDLDSIRDHPRFRAAVATLPDLTDE